MADEKARCRCTAQGGGVYDAECPLHAGEQERRAADQRDENALILSVAEAVWQDEPTEAELDITRQIIQAYREAVEPSDCNCGWGGVHDPDNPRCDANRLRFPPGKPTSDE